MAALDATTPSTPIDATMLLEPVAAAAPAPPPRRTPLAPHNARERTALPLIKKPSEAEEDEERRECKICLDAPRAVRFVGCGHSCVCAECDEMLRGLPPDRRRCPLCNELIKEPSVEVLDPTKTFRAPKAAPIKTKAEDGAKGAPRRALEDLGLEFSERVLSRGATRHAAPCLLLVPGGGFDGVGVWSTLQYPLEIYCRRALTRGWGIVCAPSMTGASKKDAEELEKAYDAATRCSGDGRIVVAAHSLGGAAVVQRCRRAHKKRQSMPCALALLDSTHKGALPPLCTIHWCVSQKPLDDPSPRPWSRDKSGCIRSAGTRDHKRVPDQCVDSVFKFLDACSATVAPPAPPLQIPQRPQRRVVRRPPARPSSPVRVVRSRPLNRYKAAPTSPPVVRRFARMIRMRAAARKAPPSKDDDAAFLTWADERRVLPPKKPAPPPKRRQSSCAARRRWRVAHRLS